MTEKPIEWEVIANDASFADLTDEQIRMVMNGEIPVRHLPRREIERLYGASLLADDPALD